MHTMRKYVGRNWNVGEDPRRRIRARPKHAAQLIANHLGIETNGRSKPRTRDDPVGEYARQKNTKADALRDFGAVANGSSLSIPMFNSLGEQCGSYNIEPYRRATKDDPNERYGSGGRHGLFLPLGDANDGPRMPQVGETWHLVEGVKDASKAHDLHADKLRYCHPWKSWLAWDGTRWNIDDVGTAQHLAKGTCDAMWADARRRDDKESLTWAAKSAQGPRVKAMVELAKDEPNLVVRPDELDSSPWLFNCENGTIDLQTGKLQPHNRADLITQLCPTKYDPNAPTDLWDKFVATIFEGDESLIQFAKRHAGYCITGDVREQLLVIAWGDGSNGKSTYLNAILETLGDAYAMQAAPDMLMQRKESHSTERMDLFRRRLVVCSETDDSAKLNEAHVKLMTGGEKVRGRRVYENNWQFDPTHKLILCTNHKPTIRGTDHAIWRRLRLVPFNVRFWNPDDGEDGPAELRQDKTLAKKLDKSRAGILRWCVEGCFEWLSGGLGLPSAVQVATSDYRSMEDVVGVFLRDCTVSTDRGRVTFKAFFERFSDYCDDTGQNRPSRKFVSRYLQEHGFETDRTGGTARIVGIALVTDHADSW